MNKAEREKRNLQIWRAYRAVKTTYEALGRKFGLTGGRIKQIVAEVERRKARLRG